MIKIHDFSKLYFVLVAFKEKNNVSICIPNLTEYDTFSKTVGSGGICHSTGL